MRLILFFAKKFWFTPYKKVLESGIHDVKGQEVESAVVVFYQCEEGDPDKVSSLLRKIVKNIKWIAGKFSSRTVVLHSFNHLSSSKAPPEFAQDLMKQARERLEKNGFTVVETPFGYLNEWSIHVAGESLAKVYKEL